jgi:hypothetical protein
VASRQQRSARKRAESAGNPGMPTTPDLRSGSPLNVRWWERAPVFRRPAIYSAAMSVGSTAESADEADRQQPAIAPTAEVVTIAATRSRADRRLDASAVLVGVVRRSRGRDAGGEAGRQRHRTKRAARGGKAAPSGAVARIFPACGCCHRRSAGRRRRSLGRRTVEGEGVCGLAPGRDAASGGPLAPLGLDHPCERMRRPFLAILRPAPVHQGSLATLHRRRAVASCVSSARQTVWIPFA